jgi:hypothetical protein
MKKITSLLIASALVFCTAATAQDDTLSAGKQFKKGMKTTGKAIGKGAKSVGHKTAEITKKGISEVKDKTYSDKTGPDGQTIYIDKHSKYYYIDKKGGKRYVTEAQLKDKA